MDPRTPSKKTGAPRAWPRLLAALRAAHGRTLRGPGPTPWGPAAVHLLLALVLLFAAVVRVMECGRGLPYIHNWDEPYVAGGALNMMKTGNWNPGIYGYGGVVVYPNLLVDIGHYFYLMARPETNPPFLSNLDDIRTYKDTGYFWEVSHPSFVRWNRWLTAAFGVGMVWLTFCLGRLIGGGWAGLIGAAYLAGFPFHVYNSGIVSVDVPVGFMAMLAVYFSARFMKEGRPAHFLWALAGCGLAVGAKINSAPVLIAPVIALLFQHRSLAPRARAPLWAAVPLLPALIYVLTNPYFVLDLRGYLLEMGRVVHLYGTQTRSDASVEPGFPHLVVEFEKMAGYLGWAAVILALAGLVVLIRRKTGWMLAAYFLAHVVFMSGARLDHHRNLILIYPVVAVALALGAILFLNWIRELVPLRPGFHRALPALGTALLLLLLLVNAGVAAERSWISWTTGETRTQAMERALRTRNEAGEGSGTLGVAGELRVHPEDLRLAGSNVLERPYLDLLCAEKPPSFLVRAARWTADDGPLGPLAALFNDLDDARWSLRDQVGKRNSLHLSRFSIHPSVEILERAGSERRADGACVADFPLADIARGRHAVFEPEGHLSIRATDATKPVHVLVEPGSYAFLWYASGTRGDGIFAEADVKIQGRDGSGDPVTLSARREKLRRLKNPHILRFHIDEATMISFTLQLANPWPAGAIHSQRRINLHSLRLLRLKADAAEVAALD